MQVLVAARSGRQQHGVQQGQIRQPPNLNRAPIALLRNAEGTNIDEARVMSEDALKR